MIIHRGESSEKTSEILEDPYKKNELIEGLFERFKELFFKPSIIAYSGGRDSSVLLFIYNYLVVHKKIPKPVIFHLNHMIRDNRIQEESIYLYMRNFPFEVYFEKKNIPKIAKRLRQGLEETGRMVRYHLLRRVSDSKDLVIVTGHHPVDYLESLLIHFIRGGGEGALSTLPIYKNNIFRPLMGFKSEEIDRLKNTSKIKIFEDESNESEDYLRNRIRKYAVAYLLNEGLDCKKLYDNFHIDEINELERIFEKNYMRISKEGIDTFTRNELKELLDLYLGKLRVHPIGKDLLLEILKRLQVGKKVYAENSEAYFWKSPGSDFYILKKNTSLFLSPFQKGEYLYWNGRKYLLPEGGSFRTYQKGSKIVKNGISKEISELFRTYQVPEPLRPNFPVIYYGDNPLILPFNLWDESMRDYKGENV